MAHPDDLSTKKFFEVEGIGHDFVPTVCGKFRLKYLMRNVDMKLKILMFLFNNE